MISKTHTSGQKPRGRQLNTKVCVSKSAIFLILCSDHFVNYDNSKTAQVLTLILARSKRMLITACSFPTTQRLHSFKFTQVNKSHSQHSEAAVRCLGRHFIILYACAHEVSFPGSLLKNGGGGGEPGNIRGKSCRLPARHQSCDQSRTLPL